MHILEKPGSRTKKGLPEPDTVELGQNQENQSTGRLSEIFRPGLGGQLVLAILFVSIVNIVAMGFATRVGFDRGFIDYLNERGVAKLDALVPLMADEYRNNGDWSYLLSSPQHWFELMGLPGQDRSAPPPQTATPVQGLKNVDTTGTGLRIALLDGDRRFIIGFLEGDFNTVERAIKVDGDTVGWLVYAPSNEAITDADLRFKKDQDQIMMLTGLSAVVIAAALAVLLSGKFIRKLRPVRTAVGELASGNYKLRLAVDSNDEIAELSADVNHLAMVLQRNESVRRNLMGDLSHELRTPIAILQAELESIHDGVQTPSEESLRSLLTEVKTLGLLVEDVYEVSSSDAGALSYRMHPVDIGEILDCTVRAFENRRNQRKIELEFSACSGPLVVQGDDGRINQLFNNLIENSMRYTYTGGKLKIHCQSDSQNAIVVFEDSAPGVPENLLASLFERSFMAMQRVDSAGKGNGLGLAICKNIVEAHRGRITAEPSSLEGLKVTVSLPLADITSR
ncbi:HAMP domain-containing protein [Parahaliea maris]|uniref:histidine kinase n=1 Tax=Parahaliea maris TaxID=2716870 RepID=A0A5C8ZP46_9GAMM|nr:ATP-binding protein [Parahaliea maris]TXS90286.1 HAMP domain-containing protein [Parahaliea maris]